MQNEKRVITGCRGEVHNAILFEQIISFLESDKMNGASVHPSNGIILGIYPVAYTGHILSKETISPSSPCFTLLPFLLNPLPSRQFIYNILEKYFCIS